MTCDKDPRLDSHSGCCGQLSKQDAPSLSHLNGITGSTCFISCQFKVVLSHTFLTSDLAQLWKQLSKSQGRVVDTGVDLNQQVGDQEQQAKTGEAVHRRSR